MAANDLVPGTAKCKLPEGVTLAVTYTISDGALLLRLQQTPSADLSALWSVNKVNVMLFMLS
jgi:hypothetical protein